MSVERPFLSRRIECPFCHRRGRTVSFDRFEDYDRHVMLDHPGENTLHCQLCRLAFVSMRDLRLHVCEAKSPRLPFE